MSHSSILINATELLSALENGRVDRGLLAIESPIGILVSETAEGLNRRSTVAEVAELQIEVRHCIMARDAITEIQKVASQLIPLQKHAEVLKKRFPGYEPIPHQDTGASGADPAAGKLPPNTAAIALPRAAEIFGLSIIESDLPANDC